MCVCMFLSLCLFFRRRRAFVTQRATMSFEPNWLRKDPLVPVLGFLGWTIPSTIPVGAFDGKSLFSCLLERIGENIAHFPTPPALTDSFWYVDARSRVVMRG